MRANVVSAYGQKKLAGVKIPPVYTGDDILLMGGDYVMKNDGTMLYAYPTIENERPTVEELLDVLKKNST